jgi:predicted site-specific integrase-resolvase
MKHNATYNNSKQQIKRWYMAEWITEKELCEWLKIDRVTAYRWRKQGLPYIGKTKSIRYNKEEIEKWLKERSQN